MSRQTPRASRRRTRGIAPALLAAVAAGGCADEGSLADLSYNVAAPRRVSPPGVRARRRVRTRLCAPRDRGRHRRHRDREQGRPARCSTNQLDHGCGHATRRARGRRGKRVLLDPAAGPDRSRGGRSLRQPRVSQHPGQRLPRCRLVAEWLLPHRALPPHRRPRWRRCPLRRRRDRRLLSRWTPARGGLGQLRRRWLGVPHRDGDLRARHGDRCPRARGDLRRSLGKAGASTFRPEQEQDSRCRL
jgi:hypothetical protein